MKGRRCALELGRPWEGTSLEARSAATALARNPLVRMAMRDPYAEEWALSGSYPVWAAFAADLFEGATAYLVAKKLAGRVGLKGGPGSVAEMLAWEDFARALSALVLVEAAREEPEDGALDAAGWACLCPEAVERLGGVRDALTTATSLPPMGCSRP